MRALHVTAAAGCTDAFRLYVALLVRTGGKSTAWPSTALLMTDCCASERTVRRWRADLVSAGLIATHRRGARGILYTVKELGENPAKSGRSVANGGSHKPLRSNGIPQNPAKSGRSESADEAIGATGQIWPVHPAKSGRSREEPKEEPLQEDFDRSLPVAERENASSPLPAVGPRGDDASTMSDKELRGSQAQRAQRWRRGDAEATRRALLERQAQELLARANGDEPDPSDPDADMLAELFDGGWPDRSHETGDPTGVTALFEGQR